MPREPLPDIREREAQCLDRVVHRPAVALLAVLGPVTPVPGLFA